ncbi:MAG: hypothetical protein V2A70_07685 [Candidatus Omnitrophota bacterium]
MFMRNFLCLFFCFCFVSPVFAIDYNVKNDTQSFLFVNGTSGNVGISSTVPRARLEVNNTAVFTSLVANTCNGSATVNWNTGNKQVLTLNGNCTSLTFTNPLGVGNLTLKIINTGSYTITWPTIKWPGAYAPTLTSSGTDIVAFFFDGTDYYGSAGFDFR